MSPPNRKPRSLINTATLMRWHRYLGLTVAALVMILAVTGWMLNHTEFLKLDSQYVQSEPVLNWYGIEPPEISTFPVGENWISELENQLYFNAIQIPGQYESLVGAVLLDNWVIVALDNQLLIVTLEGELVESVGAAEGAPGSIGAIAIGADNSLLVKGAHGVYRTGVDLLEWQQLTSEATDWSQAGQVPEQLQHLLLKAWRSQALTWERVTLDLHSGRILGLPGVWIMDLAALLMMVLAITGCYMWWRQSRFKRHR